MEKQLRLAVLVVLSLVIGGTVTVFGITLELPGLKQLKDILVTDEDILERFIEYRSDHPVAVVEVRAKNGELVGTKITQASAHLKNLCGYSLTGDQPIGKDLRSLFSSLRKWVDEEDMNALLLDHDKMMANYCKSQPALATKPIIFNFRHPRAKNTGYLPVIVGKTTSFSEDDVAVGLLTILFLRMDQVACVDTVPVAGYGYDWQEMEFRITLIPGLLAAHQGKNLFCVVRLRDGENPEDAWRTNDTEFDISDIIKVPDPEGGRFLIVTECTNIKENIEVGSIIECHLGVAPSSILADLGSAKTIDQMVEMGAKFVAHIGNRARPNPSTGRGLATILSLLEPDEQELFFQNMPSSLTKTLTVDEREL